MSDSFFFLFLFWFVRMVRWVRVLLYFKVKINCFLSKQNASHRYGFNGQNVPFQIISFQCNNMLLCFTCSIQFRWRFSFGKRYILREPSSISCQILILTLKLYTILCNAVWIEREFWSMNCYFGMNYRL